MHRCVPCPVRGPGAVQVRGSARSVLLPARGVALGIAARAHICHLHERADTVSVPHGFLHVLFGRYGLRAAL
eukprot:15057106-Alexandrium_andersonii.AAC.1